MDDRVMEAGYAIYHILMNMLVLGLCELTIF